MAQGLSHHRRNTNKKPAWLSQSGLIDFNALAVFVKRPQAAISNRRRSHATPKPL